MNEKYCIYLEAYFLIHTFIFCVRIVSTLKKYNDQILIELVVRKTVGRACEKRNGETELLFSYEIDDIELEKFRRTNENMVALSLLCLRDNNYH